MDLRQVVKRVQSSCILASALRFTASHQTEVGELAAAEACLQRAQQALAGASDVAAATLKVRGREWSHRQWFLLHQLGASVSGTPACVMMQPPWRRQDLCLPWNSWEGKGLSLPAMRQRSTPPSTWCLLLHSAQSPAASPTPALAKPPIAAPCPPPRASMHTG
ncbi:MAG: hypothetical protein WDW38_011003 [Sanguina aurantia]